MQNTQNQQNQHGVRQKLTQFGLPRTFRFALDLPSTAHKVRRVLPFRRSLPVILVITAIDVAVMFPAVSAYAQASKSWHNLDSLFDLTSAVFITAWLIGWSVAPLILSLLILVLLTGREVLIGQSGILRLGIGIPGLLFSTTFDPRKIANLRFTDPEPKSPTSWRGTHISFDYDGRQVDLGSAQTQQDLQEIQHDIAIASQGVTNESFVASTSKTSLARPFSMSETHRSEQIQAKPVTLTSLSTLVLIVSNLLPIFGAIFFGWRLNDMMVLYWAESAIIGFYNVLKLFYIGKWMALFTSVFFLAHFSGFMAIHFLFIYNLFIVGIHKSTAGDLHAVADLFISLWPALLALFISHGISFMLNFIGNKEYERITVKQQMAAPYRRIVLMQVTLILGGFIILTTHDPLPVILLFILAKIVVDVRAHLKEHAVPATLG